MRPKFGTHEIFIEIFRKSPLILVGFCRADMVP